ncbi:helix-turn-helix domain-containing protein [Roseobacter ponti]|uniref:Helix-turn-helix transcriptional regulator n=1 Tax=Roseobacter ponti TaxID=1891787 RepID=A0A858SY55_9RHOB|nr:helix-turn-helix transcriptional regulator [Roseobacter ponti]QJF51796.1 helix-turn-helix transcriptional regulator [Roseobacter ponti]
MTKFDVPDFSGALLSTIFKPVSGFAACLRGVDSLEVGLHQLATSVGARSVLLSRMQKDDRQARLVAKSVVSKGGLGTLTRPFCDNVLEVNPWGLRVGACVFRSRLDDFSESSRTIIDRWYQASGCRDTLVMVLEVNKRHVDRIEMHFEHIADRKTVAFCEEIAQALPLFYTSRAPQIIEEAIQRNLRPGRAGAGSSGAPILSDTNPYQLTRSEFRICHVVSRGISYKALPGKLDISAHTVRSHLRNIYSKVDVSDFYELSHRLVSIDERLASGTRVLMAS